MPTALITNNPPSVVAVYGAVPDTLPLPNGDTVSAASVGWTSQDGGYSLAPVTSFVPPPGQVVSGAPSYAIINGGVVETYATEAAPAPVYTCRVWQIKAVLTPAQTTAVEATIAAAPNAAILQAFWSMGVELIPSNSTTLLSLGAAIGMTANQVAALVQHASQISIP